MFNLFRREKTKSAEQFLVLDIGSEMVKALICEPHRSEVIIHGTGKARQKPGDMHSGTVMDIGSVIANCANAIEIASREAHSTASDVIMGIAGELVKGITTKTTYVRKEPSTKIDLSELKHIIHKVQRKSFEETRSQLAYETGFNEIEVKLVNTAIVEVRIDGYRVTNPIGFQGKEMNISLFNAFAPLIHYGALQTIAAELELNLLAITAEPYAIARALNKKETPVSAIIIDVGGGTTDVAIVKNGVLEATKMFTIGGRTFTKRIASSLNISFGEAEEIKLAYTAGKLEKNSEKIVREALGHDTEIWLAGVIFTLAEFQQNEALPNRILLCGGGSHLPEIKNALTSESWRNELRFSDAIKIEFLTPKDLTGFTDYTKKLTDPQDITPLALAKNGVELLEEGEILRSILKRVTRLMQI